MSGIRYRTVLPSRQWNDVDPRGAYVDRLVEVAEREPRVVVVDADLSASISTRRFHERFPGRAFQVGVAEQDLVGTAAGLAASGLIPFASSYAIFLTGRAWEQIRNAVDYGKLNVKLAGCHAGLSPAFDGPTHMGLEDLALMANLDRIEVLIPADPGGVADAVDFAAGHGGPVYFRVHRNPLPALFEEPSRPSFGCSEVIEGDDGEVGVVAIGTTLSTAIVAAETMFEQHRRRVSVWAMTRPRVDADALAALAARPLLVVEEHRQPLGVGALLAKQLLENGAPPPAFRVIGIDGYPSSGSEHEVRARVLGKTRITEALRALS